MYDVVIVGGGPAGLNAALLLGRCRRRVIVCDAGRPRNGRARQLHGFLTRDGTPPVDLLRIGHEELTPYGVETRAANVVAIERRGDAFGVSLEDGTYMETWMVLVASGVRDELPRIPGLEDCYGTTVHHCPYCDGWEARDKAIAVVGHGKGGTALALSLRTWSSRVMLCSNGPPRLSLAQMAQLEQYGIAVHDSRINAVEHEEGRVRELVRRNGSRLACEEVFVVTRQHPQCELPRVLGCEVTRDGLVKTDRFGQTGLPGLYVVGDASRDVQFAIVAAAEGAKAAVAINKALQARAGQAAAR